MVALDEMRASTNFNINIAAVTPFILMIYTMKQAFGFVFYATLKMDKSREETFASFLHVLVEIERLLVMRDNPPTPMRSGDETRLSVIEAGSDSVLSADDLGMLMLQIHELRTILWQYKRRFSADVIRSIVEDLAELSGERGKFNIL